MAPPVGDRLDSWKEIAAYLKRDVTTVQRWERREGMPVRRHVHAKLGSVYAFRSELDDWAQGRREPVPEPASRPDPPLDPPDHADPPAGDAHARPSVEPARPPAPPRWRTLAAAVGVLTTLAVLGALGFWLDHTDAFWRNPLTDAVFQPVTDFDGFEQAPAISRDGRFVAFLSDRAGQTDVWVTEVGSGRYQNLTGGRVPDLVNLSVRSLAFSPDGGSVMFWARGLNPAEPAGVGVWAVPTHGGEIRPYVATAAEVDWSADGSTLVYHTAGAGDPTFVTQAVNRDSGRPIFTAAPGLHAHFQTWSPSGDFIYFVEGSVPGPMDIWRMAPTGGAAERMTFQAAEVSHPVFLDARTLLYLSTTADGAGPWLYSLDVRRRVPHRVSAGPDRYTALAATPDGHRAAVTVSRALHTLWRLPLGVHATGEAVPVPIGTETGQGASPRLGPGYLLYVSSASTHDLIWKITNGSAVTIWSAPNARIVGGPEIASDGRHVAFVASTQGRTALYTMNADGTDARIVNDALAFAGAPAWAPDGSAILAAATVAGTPHLFRLPKGGAPTPFVSDYALDPAWSPDGRFVLFSGADIGTTFPVKAVSAAGNAYPTPPLVLQRGARRLRFLGGANALVILRHNSFIRVDLQTGGPETELARVPPDVQVQDFDVARDGSELVFERAEERASLVLIDFPRRQ